MDAITQMRTANSTLAGGQTYVTHGSPPVQSESCVQDRRVIEPSRDPSLMGAVIAASTIGSPSSTVPASSAGAVAAAREFVPPSSSPSKDTPLDAPQEQVSAKRSAGARQQRRFV